MFFKAGGLKIPQYSQETPMLETLFTKVALKLFIKKRLQYRYFPMNFGKSLRTAFVIGHRCFQADPIIYTLND